MERKDDIRPLGELFAELSRESKTLLRQEMELAKTEISHKMIHALKDVAAMGAGVAVGYTALLVLVAALVLAIGEALPLWASALIVGAVLSIVALVLIMKGRNDLKREPVTPEKTAESIKETAQWAKAQMK